MNEMNEIKVGDRIKTKNGFGNVYFGTVISIIDQSSVEVEFDDGDIDILNKIFLVSVS